MMDHEIYVQRTPLWISAVQVKLSRKEIYQIACGSVCVPSVLNLSEFTADDQ